MTEIPTHKKADVHHFIYCESQLKYTIGGNNKNSSYMGLERWLNLEKCLLYKPEDRSLVPRSLKKAGYSTMTL